MALVSCSTLSCVSQMATGRVFHDRNGNGVFDEGETGIPNVLVSNQIQVGKTDEQGHWKLPVRDDCHFFVVKPQGWSTPLNKLNLPQFYYNHKPHGSPQFKHPGVEPTGPLPESIDFALTPADEPETFEAIFFGDPQPRDQKELDYIAHDVVEELIGTDAKFGVTLGDILYDDLSLFENNNKLISLIGIPWYNVIGNHDLNFDAKTDLLADETFERHYGPAYYSFDYGPTHFVVLDNVYWGGAEPTGSGRYTAGLGAEQLAFLNNLLPHIPETKLLMLMMHIPIYEMKDKETLFDLIDQRPYTMSISGHTHWHAHFYLDETQGWKGPEPHHHVVNVTVSGSWWTGEPDEIGIPHTTMRDGAPNGYSIIRFDGHSAAVDFKAARRPSNYQLNIMAPETISPTSETPLFVNVFNGSEKSTVEFAIDGATDWVTLEKTFEHDPSYVALKELEAKRPQLLGRPLSNPVNSYHLWKTNLPKDLPLGTHRILVRTTDQWGRTFHGSRVIRVVQSEKQEETQASESNVL